MGISWDSVRRIYIIIELTQREWQAKSKLKILFERKGYEVFLIPREYLRLELLCSRLGTGDVVIEKSAQRYQKKHFEKLSSLNVQLIIFEEEGWIPFNWNDYFDRRLSNDCAPLIDEYWCSNKKQFSEVQKRFGSDFSKLVGHTRFANGIQKGQLNLHNKSVLFLSSFAMLSPDWDFFTVMKSEAGANYSERIYSKIYEDMKYKKKIFLKVANLFEASGFNVKIRLHPQEKNVFSQYELSKFIVCKANSNLKDSLSDVDMVIHSGSTVSFDLQQFPVFCIGIVDNYSNSLIEGIEASDYKIDGDALIKNKLIRLDDFLLNKKRSQAIPFTLDIIDCKIKSQNNTTLISDFLLNILYFIYDFWVIIAAGLNYKWYRRLKKKLNSFKDCNRKKV